MLLVLAFLVALSILTPFFGTDSRDHSELYGRE